MTRFNSNTLTDQEAIFSNTSHLIDSYLESLFAAPLGLSSNDINNPKDEAVEESAVSFLLATLESRAYGPGDEDEDDDDDDELIPVKDDDEEDLVDDDRSYNIDEDEEDDDDDLNDLF